MKVIYACDDCGINGAEVEVKPRESEDVVVWMTEVMTPTLVAHHNKQSPHCRPKTFTWVKVPLAAGSQRVGEETKQ